MVRPMLGGLLGSPYCLPRGHQGQVVEDKDSSAAGVSAVHADAPRPPVAALVLGGVVDTSSRDLDATRSGSGVEPACRRVMRFCLPRVFRGGLGFDCLARMSW